MKQQVFCSGQKELKREEYLRLVEAARVNGNERLCLLLQTLCSTGIRISELSYITVDAVENQIAQVDCKGKVRTIFLTQQLCRLLKEYAGKRKIQSGAIFVTRSGKPTSLQGCTTARKRICCGCQTYWGTAVSTRHVSIQWKAGKNMSDSWNEWGCS